MSEGHGESLAAKQLLYQNNKYLSSQIFSPAGNFEKYQLPPHYLPTIGEKN